MWTLWWDTPGQEKEAELKSKSLLWWEKGSSFGHLLLPGDVVFSDFSPLLIDFISLLTIFCSPIIHKVHSI